MNTLTVVMLILLVAGFICTFVPKSPGQTGFNIALFVVLLIMLLGVG